MQHRREAGCESLATDLHGADGEESAGDGAADYISRDDCALFFNVSSRFRFLLQSILNLCTVTPVPSGFEIGTCNFHIDLGLDHVKVRDYALFSFLKDTFLCVTGINYMRLVAHTQHDARTRRWRVAEEHKCHCDRIGTSAGRYAGRGGDAITAADLPRHGQIAQRKCAGELRALVKGFLC